MTVINTMARSIKILGVDITPAVKGTLIPKALEADMKEDFFYKHYISTGEFKLKSGRSKQEESKPSTIDILEPKD